MRLTHNLTGNTIYSSSPANRIPTELVGSAVTPPGNDLARMGSAWLLSRGFSEYIPPEPTLDEARTARREHIARARYEAETAGLDINGTHVRTDRQSQALLTGAYMVVQTNPDTLIDWKGEDGWVRLNALEVAAVAAAVGSHVQACFSRERELHSAIDNAASREELDNIVW